MANSDVQINKMVLQESAFSMKTPYPTRELSMLVHARKESPDEAVQQPKQYPPDAADLNSNKSHHQCGSFFAKCRCKYEEDQPVGGGASSRSHPVQVPGAGTRKKSSSPEIGKFQPKLNWTPLKQIVIVMKLIFVAKKIFNAKFSRNLRRYR